MTGWHATRPGSDARRPVRRRGVWLPDILAALPAHPRVKVDLIGRMLARSFLGWLIVANRRLNVCIYGRCGYGRRGHVPCRLTVAYIRTERTDYHIRDSLATLSSLSRSSSEQINLDTVSPKTFHHVTSVYTLA